MEREERDKSGMERRGEVGKQPSKRKRIPPFGMAAEGPVGSNTVREDAVARANHISGTNSGTLECLINGRRDVEGALGPEAGV